MEIPESERLSVSWGEKHGMMAIHDDANDGVTIAYNTTSAAKVLGQTTHTQWVGTTVPAYNPNTDAVYARDTLHSESQMAGLLRSGNFPLDPIDLGYWNDSWGFFMDSPGDVPHIANYIESSDFTLISYSSATAIGSATFAEVVPEPGSAAIVCALAGLGLIRRRRRDA